jgi:hypothetical protein
MVQLGNLSTDLEDILDENTADMGCIEHLHPWMSKWYAMSTGG